MAKYCINCGNEVNERAVVCVKCGCVIPNINTYSYEQSATSKFTVDTISQRIKINGILWAVIAAIQILVGISGEWLVLIIGIFNLASSIEDLNYSKSFSRNPVGIVKKVKPLVSPIVTLIYNAVLGGGVGVIVSMYYFIAVRGYVLKNKEIFLEIENQQVTNNM